MCMAAVIVSACLLAGVAHGQNSTSQRRIGIRKHTTTQLQEKARDHVELVRLLRRSVPGLRVLAHSEIPDARTIRVSVQVGGKR